MKKIGLIGGMSWESSASYYRMINEGVKQALGGLHSASCLLHSFDFGIIEPLQRAGAWDQLSEHMIDAAVHLEKAGAEMLLICTNTMHKVAPAVQAAVGIPLLHIVDTTADAIKSQSLHTIGLLGTRFTMEQEFYCGRLAEQHGLKVLVPEEQDREIVHQIIYEELVKGEIREKSREQYRIIISKLVETGAEGVILGCTEIPLLITSADSPIPLFDTTRLHAEKAVKLALQ